LSSELQLPHNHK